VLAKKKAEHYAELLEVDLGTQEVSVTVEARWALTSGN
jgi:hypothetical protein